METRPKVFIVSAHAETKEDPKGTIRWTRALYLKIVLASALLLGVVGILLYPRFDPKTAIRATVKVNAVVYENGQGALVKSIGTLLSADGIIVTHFHNVGNAQRVWVQNSVGQTVDATVVAADSSAGIALLKMEGRDLPFARLGSPGSLSNGATVHAVSCAGNFDFSCTTGIVVSPDRQIEAQHLIQTDIPLTAECSGAALFDWRGRLVGINAATLTPPGDFEGNSFAVPVGLVRDLMENYFSSEKPENEVTSKSEAVLNGR